MNPFVEFARTVKASSFRLFASGLLLGISPAFAGGLTLTPAVIPLRGQYGQTTTQELALSNSSPLELEFVLEAVDVVVKEGVRVQVRAGDIAHSIAATAQFNPRRVVVPPNSRRTVRVTMTLAPGAEHRAVVALFRGVTRIQNGARASTASIGTLLTFDLTGTASLKASELTVAAQTDSSAAVFEQAMVNDGREPLTTKGVVVVLNQQGNFVGKTSFSPHRLLPGERMAFRTEYPGELTAGRYRVLTTFEYSGKTVTRMAPLDIR
jgi:hypothetical protein